MKTINAYQCTFMMQTITMEGGPGTTSILVFLCCITLCGANGLMECATCFSIPTHGIQQYSCKVFCETQGWY